MDKLEDIQRANEGVFKGSNETELHIREDIADFVHPLLVTTLFTKEDLKAIKYIFAETEIADKIKQFLINNNGK